MVQFVILQSNGKVLEAHFTEAKAVTVCRWANEREARVAADAAAGNPQARAAIDAKPGRPYTYRVERRET